MARAQGEGGLWGASPGMEWTNCFVFYNTRICVQETYQDFGLMEKNMRDDITVPIVVIKRRGYGFIPYRACSKVWRIWRPSCKMYCLQVMCLDIITLYEQCLCKPPWSRCYPFTSCCNIKHNCGTVSRCCQDCCGPKICYFHMHIIKNCFSRTYFQTWQNITSISCMSFEYLVGHVRIVWFKVATTHSLLRKH